VNTKLLYKIYNKEIEGATLKLFLYKDHYFINDRLNEVSAIWINSYK